MGNVPVRSSRRARTLSLQAVWPPGLRYKAHRYVLGDRQDNHQVFGCIARTISSQERSNLKVKWPLEVAVHRACLLYKFPFLKAGMSFFRQSAEFCPFFYQSMPNIFYLPFSKAYVSLACCPSIVTVLINCLAIFDSSRW